MTTWYAWSPIDYGAEKDENDPKLILGRKRIELGEEVSPSTLGMEEDSDGWKTLVEGGVVRDFEFPEELRDPNASPQKLVSAKLRAMEQGVDTGNIDSKVVASLMQRPTSTTEGSHEITPEGEVKSAESPPPTPTTSSPTSNPKSSSDPSQVASGGTS